jgi:hypothetical protein
LIDDSQYSNKKKRIPGEIVCPSTPRLESGEIIEVFLLKFI